LLIHPFCEPKITNLRITRFILAGLSAQHELRTMFLQGLAQPQHDSPLITIGKEGIRAMARGLFGLQREEAFTLRSSGANLELT
jgi:hypothetical protein